MEEVSLTIAIPTFNGSRFVEQTVRSACSQATENLNVNVLVVDNASSDATPVVLKELLATGLDFTLVRNDETLTLDRNFEKAVSLATGGYVWLLADDDVLVPGAVSAMLGALNEAEPDVVVVNFIYVNEALIPLDGHPHTLRGVRSGLNTGANSIVLVGEEAFSEIGFEHVGLVSSNCFRRELFLAHSNTVDVPQGFEFMYVVPAIMLSGITAFVPTPLVLFRQYKKRWENKKDDHSDYLKIDWLIIPMILSLLHKLGYSSKIIKRISFQRSLSFIWHLNRAKAKGFRISKDFLSGFLMVNRKNLVLLLQTPLFFLSPNFVKYLAEIYDTRFGDVLRSTLLRKNPKIEGGNSDLRV